MICKNKLMIVLALTLILLAGCGAESSTVSPLATPEPAVSSPVPATGNETPQPSSMLPLHDVVTDPDKYVGQQVTVEGVLEAEGQMPRLRFFLVDGTDRLEVSPWAPVEAVQSPQGGGKVKTMAYYAGLRLRLTGVLEKGDEGLLLGVSAAEELQ